MADPYAADFDHELLSAYLDDELAPDERARVEARLAADPAARQLLDELRTVSQTMKSLPHAALGGDLRESVLRRAERAMLVAQDANRASITPATRLPFGRSKRAWFWAASALAAGLMLMFVERGDNRRAGVPKQVALNKPAAKAPTEPMGPLAVRALEAPPSEPGDVPLDAAQPSTPLADATDGAPASGTILSSRVDELRESAASADRFSRSGGAGGLAGGVMTGPTPEGAAIEGESLIVHVSLTPEAMQNRVFDATLLNNHIEVEQDKKQAAQSNAPTDVEVVVVEAAPAQVYSTLAEIKADGKNYVGIAVEPQSAALQSTLAKKTQLGDMRQYNRGRVTNQQQVQLDAGGRNYYFATDQEMSFRGRQLNELEAQEQEAQELKAKSKDAGQAAATPALAPQTMALGRDEADAAAARQSSPAPAQSSEKLQYFGGEYLDRASQNVARRAVQKLGDSADKLQVLFVLQADETSTSPAASAAPASAVPSEQGPSKQGLKTDE